MQTGRCLCGAVTWELSGDLITTAICHCDHCQRQSGGAFSVNLIAVDSQLSINGDLKTFEDRGEHGDDVVRAPSVLPSCGSPIVSELAKTAGVVAVKAGTLDDKSAVLPGVEVWCVDRQPWVSLPDIAVSLDRE